jgi:hypothetical protein
MVVLQVLSRGVPQTLPWCFEESWQTYSLSLTSTFLSLVFEARRTPDRRGPRSFTSVSDATGERECE